MALDQDKMVSLMREILQEDYLTLAIKAYSLEERLDQDECQIRFQLEEPGGKLAQVEGRGVGTIDALFRGLRQHLAHDYPSLSSIAFSQFAIQGLFNSEDGQESSRAWAEATVGIVNSQGREFVFQTRQPSVSRAGIEATVKAAEYFVNSERTYVRLHEILEHYRKEGRTDLVEKYTDLMTQVVQNTSYSEVVERIRAQLKG
ncbi:hypothetical protein DL240_09845 [Lujinxingia litoralis]|uniref:2-isopropylmalate synthase LeuA allosteric (dimerisation) domain-containing protein n=1 Tax=Lujinxingia litoralis TaxID=2211119 RepID=A0A328C6F8_9DELT|nr:alpha-isopropylmalate synthase regulatory domain-containing protein [Lujinxingia litoralis]RAL22148.1 hypothetical protein DL240_09845 [Lujinxingia litoralis]